MNYPEAQIRPEDEDDDRDISLEKLYLDGWRDFAARVALELNIDPNPDRSMAGSIRDLVPVFGKNKEHLKTLIDVTGGVNLDPNLQLTGLQIITAIMFLQPIGHCPCSNGCTPARPFECLTRWPRAQARVQIVQDCTPAPTLCAGCRCPFE